ncbi:hypothetical protein E2C01_059394 [Portunus trituberculatus]|uniref:Uncharacterized protein n=1 Tax=Portunus trituberculatus TaxID=210409 RepID=A0A5B7GY21_PORTR|nr:hypothetical protein [Portunus trituberculatus]
MTATRQTRIRQDAAFSCYFYRNLTTHRRRDPAGGRRALQVAAHHVLEAARCGLGIGGAIDVSAGKSWKITLPFVGFVLSW